MAQGQPLWRCDGAVIQRQFDSQVLRGIGQVSGL